MKKGLASHSMKNLNEMFTVIYGNKLDLNKMTPLPQSDGGVNFVGRSSQNHGVSQTVKRLSDIEPFPAGLITVALGGTKLLSSFIQERPFYTAQNVAVLSPKKEMTFTEKLFICLCIRHNRFRYSAFGREANRSLRTLPVPELTEFPSWVVTADVNRFNIVDKSATNTPTPILNTACWKDFRYDDIFEIQRGESYYLKDLSEGQYPYVSASAQNNGVSSYVSIRNQDGNAISLSYDGSIGEAFYQPTPFLASEKIAVLRINKKWGKKLNPFLAFFLIGLIRREKFRYNYGLKWSINSRLLSSIIKIPATASGEPDWSYMETYIKSLPYSSEIQ